MGIGRTPSVEARRFDALGVACTPIRDMEFAHHPNFRDPDDITLETCASNEAMSAWLAESKEREIPQEEIHARVNEYLASLAAQGGPGRG